MRRLPVALAVLGLLLLQPWASSLPFNPALAVSRITGATLVIVAFTIWLLRTWRSRAYRTWSTPARWAFLALVGVLAALGAAGYVTMKGETMGWPATVWFLGFPFIAGLLRWLPSSAPRPAPPA